MKKSLHLLIVKMQAWVDCWWYSSLLLVLAFADLFVFIIPTDGILVSSILARSKRWLTLAAAVTLGNTLGALIFVFILRDYGVEVIQEWMPGLTSSWAWSFTQHFFADYGLWVLFFCAATPVSVQPALFCAVIAGTGVVPIVLVTLIGRIIKH
jgi:membrane protein YqaA with SNARE-associated domain